MNNKNNQLEIKYYAPQEEKLNVLTHGVGFVLSAIALIFMIVKTAATGRTLQIVSAVVFGLSLMVLYAASTLYHGAKDDYRRKKLKVFDHAAIYVLIAGTYTPFTLVALHGQTGWILFAITWGIALVGVFMKLRFTGRFKLFSTIMYVLMGWIIVFAFNPLQEVVLYNGIAWLVAGGIAYTVGAVLYMIKSLKFNHAIFHFFVLLGSICHFISIFFYVF